MSVATSSTKQSTKVYINNVQSHARRVDITDMVLPYPFAYLSAVIYENELHIIGAYHYKWDGEWVSVSTLPVANTSGCAVVYDGEIHYFHGTAHYGWNGTEWKTYTLPSGIDMTDGRCVVYDGDLHILVGTSHYKWDGTGWTSVSTIPVSFTYGSAVVYDGELHILCNTAHYSWDGSDWTSVSTLPVSYKYGDTVVKDNKIYMIGCGDQNDQTYTWDGTDWTLGVELTIPLVKGKAVILNDSIYCIGGQGYFKMCIKHGADIVIGDITITQ